MSGPGGKTTSGRYVSHIETTVICHMLQNFLHQCPQQVSGAQRYDWGLPYKNTICLHECRVLSSTVPVLLGQVGEGIAGKGSTEPRLVLKGKSIETLAAGRYHSLAAAGATATVKQIG